MKLLLPMLIVATTASAGCASVCSRFCKALPPSGTYHVCSADPEIHLQPKDKVIIGRFGTVTNVALAYQAGEREVRLKMLPGQYGLVGLKEDATATTNTKPMANHVVALSSVRAKGTGCDVDRVLLIEFQWPQTDGRYRSSTSSPHSGHAHAQIESPVIPVGFE
ncbi:MAG TPA: hypothetical protein VJ011_04780 [Steroidobacteraceae bacterium]|nr:hypothetical protein [Steroidobacteraceae bacterium]